MSFDFNGSKSRDSRKETNCLLGHKSPHMGYEKYIRSLEWKKKREKDFKMLGRKCSICGRESSLEVHHESYENLYEERVNDVAILCKVCHPTEDFDRAVTKGYETWLRNRHGEWADMYDDDISYEKFLDYVYRDY